MRTSSLALALASCLLSCEATPDIDPALVDSFRTAATARPAIDLGNCASGIAPVLGNAALPAVIDLEVDTTSIEVARLFDEGLSVFSAEPMGYDPDRREMLFGPVPSGTGMRVGLVREESEGVHTVEVWLGPSDDIATMTRVIEGTRDGSTLTLRWLGREEGEAAEPLGAPALAGRLAMHASEEEAGAWAMVVAAEWVPPGSAAAPLSTRVLCARTADDLELASAFVNRDLDGDSFPERGTITVVRRVGVGGRAEFIGQNGRTLAGQDSVIECWDSAGSRVFVLVSDGESSATEPPGAAVTLCPAPFEMTNADLSPLPANLMDVPVDLLSLAYEGLHERLEIEPRAHRVLWVGAHPDDEVYYGAPLLGHLCRDLGGDCTMFIANAGEMSTCRFPGGCLPDLETVRRAEAVDAAVFYGATLDHRDWSNGPFPGDTTDALARWSGIEGSEDALVDAIAAVLDSVDPEIVITPDARHGGSCHAEHRVISQLVLRALDRSSATPVVYMAQNLGVPPRFSDPRMVVYDASQPSTTTGTDTWGFIGLNISAHPSQIPPESADALDATPTALRRVYFLRREDAALDDPTYLVCPND